MSWLPRSSCRLHDQYLDQLKRRRGCEETVFVVDLAPWLEAFGNSRLRYTPKPLSTSTHRMPIDPLPFCERTPANQLLPSRRSSSWSSSARAARTFSASNSFPVRLSQKLLFTRILFEKNRRLSIFYIFFRLSTSNHPQTSRITVFLPGSSRTPWKHLPVAPSLPSCPRNHHRRSSALDTYDVNSSIDNTAATGSCLKCSGLQYWRVLALLLLRVLSSCSSDPRRLSRPPSASPLGQNP